MTKHSCAKILAETQALFPDARQRADSLGPVPNPGRKTAKTMSTRLGGPVDVLLALTTAGSVLAGSALLAILLAPGAAEAAMNAEEAAALAWETPSPDIGSISEDASQNRDEVWASFEPVTAEGFEKEKAPYRDGYGALFGPASSEVVRCRDKDDTTCRAIQVLDRGFPERPSIPEEDLAGRDEIVEDSGGASGPSGDGCRPNVVTTPERVETEVCSAGGFYSDLVCRKGWEEGPATTLTRWRCRDSESSDSSFTCRVTASFTTTPVWTSTCSFGEEAATPAKSFKKVVEATARATFPALCTAPQYAVSETVCEDVLTVEKETSACTPGSVSTATNSGGADLANDPCPGGVTLTSEKTCIANEQPRRTTVKLTLEGFPSATLRVSGYRDVTQSGTGCTCRYKVLKVTCDGGTCFLDAIATVYHRSGGTNRETGTVTVRHVYQTSTTTWKETWTSTCPGSKARGARVGSEDGTSAAVRPLVKTAAEKEAL